MVRYEDVAPIGVQFLESFGAHADEAHGQQRLSPNPGHTMGAWPVRSSQAAAIETSPSKIVERAISGTENSSERKELMAGP